MEKKHDPLYWIFTFIIGVLVTITSAFILNVEVVKSFFEGKHGTDSTDQVTEINYNPILNNNDDVKVRNPTSEAENPFGKGYGKLTLYTHWCITSYTEVYIDNIYLGNLTKDFKNTPSCGEDSTIGKILSVGYHLISGRNNNGLSWGSGKRKNGFAWRFKTYVHEGKCKVLDMDADKGYLRRDEDYYVNDELKIY